MSELFTMPIIGTKDSVSWRPTQDDHARAHQNHDQTLQRLRERGGLDWTELDAILTHEDYHARKRDLTSSQKRVLLILRQRVNG